MRPVLPLYMLYVKYNRLNTRGHIVYDLIHMEISRKYIFKREKSGLVVARAWEEGEWGKLLWVWSFLTGDENTKLTVVMVGHICICEYTTKDYMVIYMRELYGL